MHFNEESSEWQKVQKVHKFIKFSSGCCVKSSKSRRWLEKLGGGPRRGSLSTSNTHMGGLTPPSYAVAHDDNSRDGTPGPAGVGAIAARMFSGLGEYVSFGGNSTASTAAGHQVRVANFYSRLRPKS